jgi:hypothetical protein
MPETVTFVLNMDTGFFSMFFRICTVCLRPNTRVVIDCSEWKYGRWSWYFRSLDEAQWVPPTMKRIGFRTLDVNLEKRPLGEYRRAVRAIFQLSPILRKQVESVINSIGKPYTAIFVRRGDKLVHEAKYIPMSDILSWITYDESTVFFVQTDDYTVIEEMRAILPNHKIHHTVPTTKRGSYHTAKYRQNVSVPWTEKTPEQAREETTEMLVGLSVCLAAEHCWSDDTSNVGRFLKLYDDKVHIYPEDYSVDESLTYHPAWQIRA